MINTHVQGDRLPFTIFKQGLIYLKTLVGTITGYVFLDWYANLGMKYIFCVFAYI